MTGILIRGYAESKFQHKKKPPAVLTCPSLRNHMYRGADKSLARPGNMCSLLV